MISRVPLLAIVDNFRRSVPPRSDVKQRIFHVEPGLVLSGFRLMTVITVMRCFLRPWVPSTHIATHTARKTHASVRACARTSAVHNTYVCTRQERNDLHTRTYTFRKRTQDRTDHSVNENFLHWRGNQTTFVCIFFPAFKSHLTLEKLIANFS